MILQRRKKPLLMPEHAVAAFLRDPVPCLTGFQGTDPWRDNQCENLYVKSMGLLIGYVHQIYIDDTSGVATIGHFAVEQGYERRGVGWRLAMAIRDELARRYGIAEIVFMENSTRYLEAGYPEFFRALGAQAKPSHWLKPTHADWIWKF